MRDNKVLGYIGRYRWRYLMGFLTLIGASLVVMLPPIVVRDAVDALDEGTSRGRLAEYGAIILGMALVESVLRFGARLLVSGTSRYVEYDIRNELAARFMELDQRFYLESQTGDLMARCTNDLQIIRDLMGPILIDLCRIFTMMIIGFGFLLTIDVRLALFAIAYFPVIGVIIYYFRIAVEAKFRAVQDQFGEVSTRVQENMSGMRTIKAYAQEESEIVTFAASSQELMKRSMAWAYYTAAMWPLMTVLVGASTILVLWFGGRDVVSGNITIGQFVQFNTYLVILANPVMSLGWTATAMQQGSAAMKRITEVLAAVPRVRDPQNPTHLENIRGELELRNLSFGYTDRPVLQDIDLKIPAGSTVALVAGTGGGKTTLVNLLTRLYDPWEGQVLLDGVDIRELSLAQLRDAIGVVPQETFLFSDSLKDNVGYGRMDAPDSEIAYAVETSQLVNDLPQLTNGIETVIGERGVTLSGGQKQRTALARALLKRPPVVILDDALSHVDTHTEEEILRRLHDFMRERTTIIIAHRTSTLASADFIVSLEEGRIAEVGTHEELLNAGGVYSRFYQRQLLAEQVLEEVDAAPGRGPGRGSVTTDYELEEDEVLGKAYDSRVARRLAGYLKPYLRPVFVSVVLLLGVACLEIAGPLILKEAIDGQIRNGRTDRLGLLVGVYAGTLAGIFVLRYIQGVLMAYVGQRVMLDMRVQLFTHLQRMSIAFFDRNPVGRLITRLTNDIATLEMVISQGVVAIITNLLMVSVIMVVLVVLDWRLALIMFAVLPFMVVAVQFFAFTQRDAYREQRAWLARINSYLNENITGMAVIQLFNRQRENLRRFEQRNQGLLRTNLKQLWWYAVFEPTVVLFGAITTALILWYGGGRVVQDALTLGTLVAFIQYMQRFYWPIRDLSDRYTTLQSAMASSERIFGVLDEAEEVTDVDSPVHLTHIEGKIEFRNVWFAYDEGNWVLRDVSFTLQPGEKVAIVGATGAGKSTMMSLLNRFYDVQRGQILVDDVPITSVPQRALRRHVGLVLQDPFIFTDSIQENIRLRDQSISIDEVKAAARLVGADAFIMRIPEGYEALLAERGANLSTGQKQLLALARVSAFNPEIVLVMDEATASIDPETEASLQRSIRQVTANRTSIIIAHRLNTIRFVDRILVLQQGHVVEEGTHEQLLASRGVYFRLYELQYKDQDLALSRE